MEKSVYIECISKGERKMNFTIPATKNTKAVVVSITLKGMIIAFITDVKKTSKGDEVLFFNKHGFSRHVLKNDY